MAWHPELFDGLYGVRYRAELARGNRRRVDEYRRALMVAVNANLAYARRASESCRTTPLWYPQLVLPVDTTGCSE